MTNSRHSFVHDPHTTISTVSTIKSHQKPQENLEEMFARYNIQLHNSVLPVAKGLTPYI